MKTVLVLPPLPDFSFEASARRQGLWPVAGVDEAGRGPLAGPVVAAAVILDPDHLPIGLNDSKQLSATGRKALFRSLCDTARAIGIASIPAAMIDRINIRQAALLAMRRAVASLVLTPLHVLIDGRDVPPLPPGMGGEALVKGDARSMSVAAASIVAKVTRDQMMEAAAHHFVGYDFAVHKGYGTKKHRNALMQQGPCALHRLTFGSVSKREG